MNDLISREAAIAAFMTSTADGDKFEWCEWVLKKLPPAQPELMWIPVSEGLPKAGVRYQVTFESGEVGYADFRNKIFLPDGTIQENVWECEQYYEEDGKVIAWMPLPEPYKDEKGQRQ